METGARGGYRRGGAGHPRDGARHGHPHGQPGQPPMATLSASTTTLAISLAILHAPPGLPRRLLQDAGEAGTAGRNIGVPRRGQVTVIVLFSDF